MGHNEHLSLPHVVSAKATLSPHTFFFLWLMSCLNYYFGASIGEISQALE
ncbi:hypothetical protein CsSME_00021421 [Camellia sinensis var. sinensis]